MESHVSKVRQLYKAILKLHRGLPSELKMLGDQYVKDEFRRHKTSESRDVVIAFLQEWTNYTKSLSKQLGRRGPVPQGRLGHELSESHLEHMRQEQLGQLYELKLAAESKTDGKPT